MSMSPVTVALVQFGNLNLQKPTIFMYMTGAVKSVGEELS